jgi:3-hydroxybutyryl-CoA dehydrogenase
LATEAVPGVIGVVGAGTMGAGIAQVALEHGHEVLLHDVDEAAIARGRERVRDGLAKRAAKAGHGDRWVDATLMGLREATALDEVAAEAELVVEAVHEDLELKRTVFLALDEGSDPQAILASNTSALPVSEIAATVTRPERVLGLHFFNPAPVMPLVEVVRPPMTAEHVVVAAERLLLSWGKVPVRCADSPGFIVNRVNRPFTIEALRVLEEGAASVEAIDAALRARGFPMGPFELIDLVGVDVNLAAARGVYEGLGRPERLRPSPLQEDLVEHGRLGRKTGIGFYRYEAGRSVPLSVGLAGPAGFASAAGGLSPDEIAARILDAIADEARRAAEEGVASPVDIDRALRLGAGHPEGPFERAAGAPERDPGQ